MVPIYEYLLPDLTWLDEILAALCANVDILDRLIDDWADDLHLLNDYVTW